MNSRRIRLAMTIHYPRLADTQGCQGEITNVNQMLRFQVYGLYQEVLLEPGSQILSACFSTFSRSFGILSCLWHLEADGEKHLPLEVENGWSCVWVDMLARHMPQLGNKWGFTYSSKFTESHRTFHHLKLIFCRGNDGYPHGFPSRFCFT